MSEKRSKWDTATSTSATDSDAAAAAAAAAAKIAAQFAPPNPTNNSASPSNQSQNANPRKRPHQDSEAAAFQKEIVINDLRNRYMLTKGQTAQQVYELTGASVSTKGTWYPDINQVPAGEKPLYLHIEATTQEMLEKAVAKVEDLIKNDAVPDLHVIDRRGREREMEREAREKDDRDRRDRRGGRIESKVPVTLETLPNFNVRAKVVGPGGLFVKYIQSETGTRVQLKGLGSGFIDHDIGRENDEGMHVHISGQDEQAVAAAKELAVDLLDAVNTEYEKARAVLGSSGPMGPGPRGGGGGYMGNNPLPMGNGWGGAPAGGQAQAHSRMGSMNNHHQGGHIPPPPPEDDQPPPPPGATQNPTPTPKAPEPELDELTKYWRDYIKWEDSFKAYHKRTPTKDEGGQDVPPQYR